MIVLADDHLIVRQGLKTVRKAEPDYRVIGEAGDGQAVRTEIRGLSAQIS
jgi:DNA-binding NarL/FixJ family response regulator